MMAFGYPTSAWGWVKALPSMLWLALTTREPKRECPFCGRSM